MLAQPRTPLRVLLRRLEVCACRLGRITWEVVVVVGGGLAGVSGGERGCAGGGGG